MKLIVVVVAHLLTTIFMVSRYGRKVNSGP